MRTVTATSIPGLRVLNSSIRSAIEPAGDAISQRDHVALPALLHWPRSDANGSELRRKACESQPQGRDSHTRGGNSHRIAPRLAMLKCDSQCDSQLGVCDSQLEKCDSQLLGVRVAGFFVRLAVLAVRLAATGVRLAASKVRLAPRECDSHCATRTLEVRLALGELHPGGATRTPRH